MTLPNVILQRGWYDDQDIPSNETPYDFLGSDVYVDWKTYEFQHPKGTWLFYAKSYKCAKKAIATKFDLEKLPFWYFYRVTYNLLLLKTPKIGETRSGD